MQYSVEKVSSLERKMKIEIPAAALEDQVEQKLQHLSKTVKLAGFRQGKVPLKVVKSHYGEQVRGEVLADLMKKYLYEALAKENDKPAVPPSITSIDQAQTGALVFEAKYEVIPHIDLKDAKEQTYEKIEGSIEEHDIDQMLESIRKQHATWHAKDAAAAMGDKVTIDFVGTIDGSPFEGGKGDAVSFVIGSNTMLKDFENGLVGMTKGQEKDLKMMFPTDYRYQDLAGKYANFHIHLNQVEYPELPTLDEKFVKSFNIQDGNIQTLRHELKENMKLEMEHQIRLKMKNQVLEKLLEVNTLELPQSLVDQEIAHMRHNAIKRAEKEFRKSNQDIADAFPNHLFEKEAKKRVRLTLIVSAYIRKHSLQVDKDKVRKRIETIASAYERPDEVIAWLYKNQNQLTEIEASVLEEQVIDHILEHTQIIKKKVSYNEIMKR